jgi:hypothetical protein
MRTALRFLIPLALALAVILPGCYTVVMHPSDEGGYRADQTSDCVRCHGSYHEYPYGYYYDPYPSWWWDYSNYGSYYAYPWWWRYYDYPYLDGDYSYDNSGTSHRGTKFDRRETGSGPMPPPHSWGTGGYDQPVQPGINDQVQDISTGGQGTGAQSRPGTDSDESGSRTKDETVSTPDSKDSRQSTVRQPAPPPSDNSGNTTKPAETKDTKQTRTKSRDGGGKR